MKIGRRAWLALVGLALVAASLPIGAQAAVQQQPDDTWGANDRVNAILRVGGTVVLGGDFGQLRDRNNSVARSFLGALDAATGEPTTWNPGLDGKVFALALSEDGGTLFVGGNFNRAGGASRRKLAAYDTATWALLPWKAPSPNSTVRALAVDGDVLYVGGSFTSVGGTARERAAAVGVADASLRNWDPSPDDLVRSIVPTTGRVYLGGNFVQVNGTNQGRLAAVHPTTGASISIPYHPLYPVLDMAADGTRLFLAGGGGGGRAAAMNLATGARLWEQRGDGNVQGVGVQGDFAFFGGHFFTYDGVAVQQLVRVDKATGALDTTWLPTSNGFLGVFAVEGRNNKLYVGGDFDHVAGRFAPHFAQFTDNGIASRADLRAMMTDAPDPVRGGAVITYDVTVANGGPDLATGVVLTDTLPAALTYRSDDAGCSYDDATSTLTCSLGNLAVGASKHVAIKARAGSAGTRTNRVRVASNAVDPTPGNNRAAATTVVTKAGGSADVALAVASWRKVAPGAKFTYALKVSNRGPRTAKKITVKAPTPKGASLVSAPRWCSDGATVTCVIPKLGRGSVKKIKLIVRAPAAPMTIVFKPRATVGGRDPNASNNRVVRFTTVRKKTPGDTTAPGRTGTQMLDEDADGRVDALRVLFNEPIAACLGPCRAGWIVTGIPSGGTLASVSTSGNAAILRIAEGPGDPDTTIGSLRVALGAPNQIQDAAGNHPSLGAVTPVDRAGPVPIAVRKKNAGTLGLIESGDSLTVEWSEPLAPGSVSGSTTFTLTDPSGSGDDRLAVSGFTQGSIDAGSDGYVGANGASATWSGSDLQLVAPNDILTATVGGACGGSGCASLGTVGSVTIVYVPASSLEDAAGNAAEGRFTKTFTVF